MTPCKSCGAEIIWAKTANGKNIPLDASPVPDGNIVLDKGIAVVLREKATGELLYKSHFATCPQAKQHRRPK